MLTPPVGSHPLPRWARGPLSVPCRSGTLAYKLQVQDKEQDVLPHFPQLWTLPPPPYLGGLRCYHMLCGFGRCLPAREGSDAASCPPLQTLPPRSEGLRCCHMSHGFRPCLPARDGSDTITCPTALDPTSLLRRVLALPHASRLRTQCPYSGGFRHCHVPRSFRPCLPAREGSNATMCLTALNGLGATGIKKGLAGVGM
jgi:hypothetical protein